MRECVGSAHGSYVYAHAHFITADLLSTYDIIHQALPFFQHATLKNWVWPGDEAIQMELMYTCTRQLVFRQQRLTPTFSLCRDYHA